MTDGPGAPRPEAPRPDAPPPEPAPPEPAPPDAPPPQPDAPKASPSDPWTQAPSSPPPSAAPPSAPAAAPPPYAPPSYPPPPQPGSPPPSGTGYQYGAPVATYPPAYAPSYGPQKTNGTAIISLIFGIANFVICPFIGAIVAIITGHVSLGQIKRSEGREGGKGIARAGTILGYVGLALSILGIVAVALTFGVFGDDISRAALRSDAHEMVDNAQREAQIAGTEVRDATTLRRAYADTSFEDNTDVTLADGTPILAADDAAWERSGWRMQMHGDLLRSVDICVVIPETAGADPVISNGACPIAPAA